MRIAASGSDSISYGSGTLVGASDQQGLVITNWHVINEATGPITVLFPDGFQSPATVQKVDREWDLAALAVRRPRAQPAPIASEPARPGDLLTIAGYGAGQYRAVTGRCTQYVAPGMTFPYEMVELAAAARRGDSGGPIFNARGELVGVLFGEGGGRTTGSYCGRVRWFLDSLLSKELSAAEPGEAERLADQRPRGAPGARVASLAPAVERRQQTARNDPAAVASGELEPANFRSALTKRSDAAIRVLSSPDDGRPPRTTTDRPAGISAPAAAITGESPAPSSFDLPTFAEIEAVLAAIGGFALLAQITRWLGTSGAAR